MNILDHYSPVYATDSLSPRETDPTRIFHCDYCGESVRKSSRFMRQAKNGLTPREIMASEVAATHLKYCHAKQLTTDELHSISDEFFVDLEAAKAAAAEAKL